MPLSKCLISLPDGYQRVQFSTESAAPSVYLLLGDADGTPRSLHLMDRGQLETWHVELRLKSDMYRYRYYAIEEVATAALLPDGAGKVHAHLDAMDAVVDVPSQGTLSNASVMHCPSTMPATLIAYAQ